MLYQRADDAHSAGMIVQKECTGSQRKDSYPSAEKTSAGIQRTVEIPPVRRMTTVRKWIMGGPMVREEQRCQRTA